MTDNEPKDKFSELQKRANQPAVEESPGVTDISGIRPEQIQQLIQELQAQKVELEKQNEELCRINRDLQSSRDRLAELHDLDPAACFGLDRNGMIEKVNLAGCDLIGIQRDLLIGRPLANFVHKEDEQAIFLHIKQVLQTQTKQTCDIRLLREDGNQVSVRLQSYVQRDQDGVPTGLETFVIDVTERKEAERKLAESEEQLQLALRGADLGLWDYNLQTGEAFISQRRAEMVGYSVDEVEPHMSFWGRMVHPEDVPRVIDAFNAHANGETPFYECEHRLRHKSGEYIWVLARAKIVERSEKGSPVRLIGTSLDITERKQAEDILQASELRYRGLFESTQDGILIVDFDGGKIVDVNPQLIDLLGYSREEYMGRNFWEVSPFQRTAAGKTLVAELREKGSISRNDLSIETKSGRNIDVEFVSNSFLINGKTFIQCNIRRSDQVWVQIFNAISDGIMIVDGQHKIARINKAMARSLGVIDEEAIGRSCFELVHGEKKPPQFCPHSTFLTDRKKHSAEVFEPRLGGIYDVRVFPLLGQDDQRLRSVHIVRDITQKKRRQEKIQQQSEFLGNVLNSLTHPFYVVDISDFTVTIANRAAELLGITVGQKCYAAAKGRTGPCSDPKHICPVIEVEKTGKPVTSEHIHLYDEKGPRNVEVHTYPIFNAAGRVSQVIEYVLDITERKLAEEALERRIIALTRPLDQTGEISFEDLFNLDEIQKLQDQFAKAVGVASLITRPDGTPITKAGNFSRLCSEIIRKTEIGQRNCQHSDSMIGKYNPDGPTVQSCLSAGLCNAGSSISVGGKHIANWLIGQVRNETQDIDSIRAYARVIGVNEDEFVGAYYEVPVMSREHFACVAQAMHTLAQQLSTTAYQNVQQARFIAERKQAEEALRQSEQRYSLAIEGSRVGVVDWDVPTGKMVWSPRVFTILGYEPDEFQPTFSLVMEKFIHPESLADLVCRIYAHHEEHLPAEVECRVITKDGTLRWVRLSGHSSWDEEGRPLRTVGTVEDITERKYAEEARLKSERQYRNLFDESRDGVFAVLREGEIADANPAFCEIFGYEKEELIGRSVLSLYSNPDDHLEFRREIEKKGFVKDYEIKFKKKDGTEIDCLLTASVQFGEDGSILGYRGIMRDLTIYKQLQKQLFQAQKMEAIGTLAGGIAHDFNNLLQVVLGYTDMLIMRKASESPDLKALKSISKAAKDGGELVKGLLTFSRQVESSKISIDLIQHLQQTKTLLTRLIPKTIETDLILASDLATVNADPIQLNQVLMNLAINAGHAMPKGGRLTIEARNTTLDEEYCRANVEVKPGEYVMLTISDNGCGMEKEVMSHIFEPFFTTKEPGEGTGLGLAIVYGIVKNHDGHITCFSKPGRGTTFSIYFPVASRKPELAKVQIAGERAASGTEAILLVDDEQPIISAVENILLLHGYKVFTAQSGNEALDIYREKGKSIDLVILDLNMPGMSGMEALEAILQVEASAKVLIATGHPMSESAKHILSVEAGGFISKPFDANDILRAVRTVLDETHCAEFRTNSYGVFHAGSSESKRTSPNTVKSSYDTSMPGIEKSKGLRILAIDDRLPYLRMLEMGLAQFGQTPIIASSGILGLQTFQDAPVDVVVCDLDMPELDGWAVAKRIKEICGERGRPRPPFILLTGDADLENVDQVAKQRMADHGVDAIVGKPIDIPDLLVIIERLMNEL